MKGSLLLLLIIVMMNCVGQSTTTSNPPYTISAPKLKSVSINDTMCFPRETLKRVLVAAQQKSVLEEQVNVLNERIKNYQNIITNLNEKDSATIEGYNLQIQAINQEKIIYQDQVSSLEKMLKKERRKRKWTAFGGIALTGIIGYLYIVK